MNMKFAMFNRQEYYDAIKPNQRFVINETDLGDQKYITISDFFADPEKAIWFLNQYPALDGGTYTPGARQNFTPMDLAPVLNTYVHVLDKTNNIKSDASQFITSSIIVNKDSRVWTNSWYPHTDYDIVCNLFMNNYNGGTALYKFRGECSSKKINSIRPPVQRNLLVPWQNFEGDSDWELYHVIPTKFNSVSIYDGTNFHGTYSVMNEEYRWSIISFYRKEMKFS